MKDNKEKLTKEVEENVEVEETGLSTIQGFGALGKRTETKCNIYTNITDQKKIFNLDSKVDNLLNLTCFVSGGDNIQEQTTKKMAINDLRGMDNTLFETLNMIKVYHNFNKEFDLDEINKYAPQLQM